MSNEHHFKTEEAEKYGIEKAVLLYNIRFWLERNKANNNNVYEKNGKEYFWTYNSSTAFGKLFPYLAESTIRRYLMELEVEDEVLISGNFNKHAYDRTKWYTMPEYQTVAQIEQCNEKNEQPIPDNNTDTKHKKIEAKASTLVEKKVSTKLTPGQTKYIGAVAGIWKDMAASALDIPKKDVEDSKLFISISNVYKREKWDTDDFKALFKYFFADEGMKRENKLSYGICLSQTYIAKYKLSKKGKPKTGASLSGDIKL